MSLSPAAAVGAGAEAVSIHESAIALHRSGAHNILQDPMRYALRRESVELAEGALRGGGGALSPIAQQATKAIAQGAMRAGGVGAILDGSLAAAHAVDLVRKGEVTAEDAAIYVAEEAGTGALACAAGVALAAGVVALTGPVGPAVMFALGASGSIATKNILTSIIRD